MVLKRVRLGSFTFAFHFAKITRVTGVLSRRFDGSHFILWEFDDYTLVQAKKALRAVQKGFHLPDIFIASSGRGDHYHAYCFTPVSFRLLVRILASTDGIDLKFLRWTLYRGEATLRIGPKAGRTIAWVGHLPSRVPYTIPKGGFRFIEYETVWPGWG
jgi:hypothetical protein